MRPASGAPRLRFAAAALACALAWCPADRSAVAQETPGEPAPAAAPAPDAAPQSPPLLLRAIDLSAMVDEFRKSGAQDPAPAPLADRDITVLTPAATPDGPPREIHVRTDADGRFEVPLDGVKPGSPLEFLVPGGEGASHWPVYVAPSLTVGEPPPAELSFVRVHQGASPLAFPMMNVVATVPGRKDGFGEVRLNVIAMVRNDSDHIWIGSPDEHQRGTIRIPVPGGFHFVNAQLGSPPSGRDVEGTLADRPGGGREVILHERIWPAVLSPNGGQSMLRVVLVSEKAPTGPVDLSFRAENVIEQYGLNVEEDSLHYEAGEGLALTDGGVNQAMPGTQGQVTHAWRAEDIRPGTLVSATIVPGPPEPPPIDRRVWYTIGTLALVLVGAALLGLALSQRGARKAIPAPVSAEPDDVRRRLAELDVRLRRGEISKFEHAARRAQVEGVVAARPAPPPPGAANTPGGDPRKLVDAVSARVDTADEETLRRDLRSLLALARDLLR